VIFRIPNWEDFVHLAFTEIRFYGAENMQIARRLRAMIVNLTDSIAHQPNYGIGLHTHQIERLAASLTKRGLLDQKWHITKAGMEHLSRIERKYRPQ
jgi:hypothetical protein